MSSMFCYWIFLSADLYRLSIFCHQKIALKSSPQKPDPRLSFFSWFTFKIMYDTQFRVATFSINLSQIEIKVSDYRLIWSSSLIYISVYIYANTIVVGSTPSHVKFASFTCDRSLVVSGYSGCLGILWFPRKISIRYNRNNFESGVILHP